MATHETQHHIDPYRIVGQRCASFLQHNKLIQRLKATASADEQIIKYFSLTNKNFKKSFIVSLLYGPNSKHRLNEQQHIRPYCLFFEMENMGDMVFL